MSRDRNATKRLLCAVAAAVLCMALLIAIKGALGNGLPVERARVARFVQVQRWKIAAILEGDPKSWRRRDTEDMLQRARALEAMRSGPEPKPWEYR